MSNRAWLLVLWLCVAVGCTSIDEDGAAFDEGDVAVEEQALAAQTARFNLDPNCESRRAQIQRIADRVMQLLGTTPSDASFTKWFGVTESEPTVWEVYHTIVANVALYGQESMMLLGAAARETNAHLISFRCDSVSNSTAAEIVPTSFGTDHPTIRFNAEFWNEGRLPFESSVFSPESQTATLIHELAHLATGNKSHPDFFPGNEFNEAQELAQTDRLAALNSVYNYEFYFAGL